MPARAHLGGSAGVCVHAQASDPTMCWRTLCFLCGGECMLQGAGTLAQVARREGVAITTCGRVASSDFCAATLVSDSAPPHAPPASLRPAGVSD